ncbi:hypothetical protein ACNHKD_03210 [Methylocystis sp. JAN1]|uniref:hypothetical protein n=1 Tax=Methylocystis sp. JAN1 TaxID=3397211 RepID=UPI003FA32F95
MNRKFLAAALVAPLIALGPTTAFAHHCSKYHRHHARGADQTYGSSKSMQNKRSGTTNQGSSSQDLNQGTGQGGATDQGASGSSKRQGI